MKYIFLMLAVLASQPVTAAELSSAGEKSATLIGFAIAPQQSPRELAKRWGPIIQYISEHSGVPLQFQTAKDIATYQQEMKAGAYDISFINAYNYLALGKEAGYKVFAQEKDAKFVSIILVRKDSPYQTLEELDGKQIAFPGPAVASRLAYTHLVAKNIRVTPSYVISVDSVYRSVAKGLFPVGQGEMRTFSNMDPEIRDQLRILWSSDPLPSFNFSAHPRVPAASLKKIQQAMLKMGDSPEGQELLKVVNMKGFAAAHDSEYESLRKLKLLTLDPPPKPE